MGQLSAAEIYKDNHAVDGGAEALRSFKRMHYFISMHDMTNPENYKIAVSMFDVDSYIDYYAVKIYVSDTDWPMKNYAAWRADSGSSGHAQYDMVVHAIRRDYMFASLMANGDFRAQA